MTCIQFASDLHIDHGMLDYEVLPDTDVVIIAGDLDEGVNSFEWLEELKNRCQKPIVYVPGNHCFWGTDMASWLDFAKARCQQIGVNFLYNDTVVIDEVAYIGTTLWTDYNINGQQVLNMMASKRMKDFDYIKYQGELITADYILAEHQKARAYIKEALGQHKALKRCVVTHHAPSSVSLGEHKTHRSAPFYASDLSDVMLDHNPDVWIHGHIHSTNRYFIGDTLVVSNARGYRDVKLNEDFYTDMQLEF